MRIKFKDGSVIEHVAAASAIEEGGRLILKTAEGDVVADLDRNDVESWETVTA